MHLFHRTDLQWQAAKVEISAQSRVGLIEAACTELGRSPRDGARQTIEAPIELFQLLLRLSQVGRNVPRELVATEPDAFNPTSMSPS